MIVAKKTERLDAECHEPRASADTVGLKHVQSTKQHAPCYSPAAQNIPVAWADVYHVREMYEKQDYSTAGKTWVGCLFKSSHQIVVRFKNHMKTVYIALVHYKDSSCLVWPGVVSTVQGTRCKIAIPDKCCDEPIVLPITDLSKVDVFHYRFRAYSSLIMEYPVAKHRFKPGVVFFYVFDMLLLIVCVVAATQKLKLLVIVLLIWVCHPGCLCISKNKFIFASLFCF